MTLPVRDTLHEAFFAVISFPDLLMECQLSKEFLDHQFVFLHDLEAPAKATSQKGTFAFSAPHAGEATQVTLSPHLVHAGVNNLKLLFFMGIVTVVTPCWLAQI